MGSPPVIPNGKGAAAVVITAWASWVPAVSVVCGIELRCAKPRVPDQRSLCPKHPLYRGVGFVIGRGAFLECVERCHVCSLNNTRFR